MDITKDISVESVEKQLQETDESWLAEFGVCWKTDIFSFWYSPYKDSIANSVTSFEEPNPEKASEAIKLIVLYARDHGMPFSLALCPSNYSYDIGKILTTHGCVQETSTVMICYLDSISVQDTPEFIRPLCKHDNVVQWMNIFNAVFGEEDPNFTKAYTDLIHMNLGNRIDVENYEGYLDKDMVTIGTLFVYDGYGLIANIATHPQARKKGMATMMTSALIQRAKKIGLNHLLLTTHSSQKLYEKVGFKKVMDREEYIFTPL
jgi:ribosomal protein S18 acetylase RimI-like enzyme